VKKRKAKKTEKVIEEVTITESVIPETQCVADDASSSSSTYFSG